MRRNGYIRVEEADENAVLSVCIINSCTVTENADRKVKSLILRLKKENPAAKIVLCGCFPKAFPDKARESGADRVIEGAFRFPFFEGINPVPPYLSQDLPKYSLQNERTRAYLKIQDGCDRGCAYCIIPKARGASASRSLADIREEAKILAARHKEIVITGINLCLYEYGLVNAAETVCRIDGFERVRLGSIEPDMISESDIARLAKLPKLCNHFHLSLQSGSDSVLKRMNRRYTTADYRRTANLIRMNFPGAALTTDIIAGFPGETEEEFVQTLTFAEEMGFAKIHAFAFSLREGTSAAVLPKQISKEVKRGRTVRLCGLAEALRAEFFKKLQGTEQQVLIEKNGNDADGFSYGHTSCYTPVKICGRYDRNSIVKVKITTAEKEWCVGQYS
jgi:threonylcarbamoyladenosine tRNA methylthiotransferase MtaB